MTDQSLIAQLAEAFQCLPGIGPKSARRMVMYLLERDREGGVLLAERLQAAMTGIGNCSRCRNLTEHAICEICANPARDISLLCIVETPSDVAAVEQTGTYRGYYYVLMGHLSPIDGVGPVELGLDDRLHQRVREGGVAEVILATNPTVEGEATAHFVSSMLKDESVTVSRLAHGLPVGGEIEYVDGGTLAHALAGRHQVKDRS